MQTIRLGVVPPGGTLPSERELAVRFSVSRDTVREAIRELSDTGYLTLAPRAVRRHVRQRSAARRRPSPRSMPPTATELDDLLGLREILEVGAARAAATRTLDGEARALLWTRLGEVAAASTADYRRLDSRLHLTIGEIVGVPSLVTVLADNRTRLNELLDSFPLLPRNIEHSNRQHEAIVLAILSGNEEGAAEAVREHLEGSAALLRGFLT